jgi:hypothetical protein
MQPLAAEARRRPVVSAREYLVGSEWDERRGLRVYNFCRTYGYQTLGYYVSLLAAARGHRPIPTVERCGSARPVVRLVSDSSRPIQRASPAQGRASIQHLLRAEPGPALRRARPCAPRPVPRPAPRASWQAVAARPVRLIDSEGPTIADPLAEAPLRRAGCARPGSFRPTCDQQPRGARRALGPRRCAGSRGGRWDRREADPRGDASIAGSMLFLREEPRDHRPTGWRVAPRPKGWW